MAHLNYPLRKAHAPSQPENLYKLIGVSLMLCAGINLAHATPSVWTVTSIAGSGGVCTANSTTDPNCTLSAAISQAASVSGDPVADPANTGDTIVFSQAILNADVAGRTILTASALYIFGKNLTIDASPGEIILDGQDAHAVFGIGNNDNVYVSLRNLTIQHGYKSTSSGGGFSANSLGLVTLDHCRVADNRAANAGGIANYGNLTLLNSTITGNEASSDSAGGVYHISGTLIIDRSTIDHNTGNTLSTNNGGGGIHINSNAIATITNSTIAHNTAYRGGGITSFGTLTLSNSTVVYNTAISNGGGLNIASLSASSSLVSLFSTLAAQNTVGGNQNQIANTGTLISRGYNLIGIGSSSIPTPASTDQQDVADPLLASTDVTDNGGPTYTFALQSGSPALGNGNCDPAIATIAIGSTDQRDVARPITQCDVGAFAETVFRGDFE